MKISTIILAAIGGVSANQVGRSALSSNPELGRKLVTAYRSNSNRNAVSAECATGIEELTQNATLLAAIEALESQCPNAYRMLDALARDQAQANKATEFMDLVVGCPDSVNSDLKDTCEVSGGSFTEPMSVRIVCSVDSESFEVVSTFNDCIHPSCDFDNYYLEFVDDLKNNDDSKMQQVMNKLEAVGVTCTISSAFGNMEDEKGLEQPTGGSTIDLVEDLLPGGSTIDLVEDEEAAEPAESSLMSGDVHLSSAAYKKIGAGILALATVAAAALL